jgi:hypothetical protein
LAALALLAVNAAATAQPCPSDPPAATLSNTHSSSLRSAIRTTLDLSNAAQLACHRATANLAIDVHHLSLAPASLVMARQTRMELDSRAADEESQIRGELGEVRSPAGQQLNVPWRTTLGPAWVGNVPDWMTETAKNYRHRGLPLVDLWQSSHYTFHRSCLRHASIRPDDLSPVIFSLFRAQQEIGVGKIDKTLAPRGEGSRYPAPFDIPCRQRSWHRLGDAANLTQFGVNLVRLSPEHGRASATGTLMKTSSST